MDFELPPDQPEDQPPDSPEIEMAPPDGPELNAPPEPPEQAPSPAMEAIRSAARNLTEPLTAPFAKATTTMERIAAPAVAARDFAKRPLLEPIPGAARAAQNVREFYGPSDEELEKEAGRTGKMPYKSMFKRMGGEALAMMIPQTPADVAMMLASPAAEGVAKQALTKTFPRLARPLFGAAEEVAHMAPAIDLPPDAPTARPPVSEARPPAELPVIQPGSKTGEPHALFSFNDDFGPEGAKRSQYTVFGDPSNPVIQKVGYGSTVGKDVLEEAGIPVTGREPRTVGKWEPLDLEQLYPKAASAEAGAVKLGPDVKPGEPSPIDNFKREFYDRMEPIKYKPGEEFAPEFPNAGGKYTESYVSARTLPGKIKAQSEGLLKELNDVIAPLENFEDREALNRIYTMRNFADLDRMGKTTSGVTADVAETELARLQSELGPERFKRIAQVADSIADIQNNKALDILVEGKVITPESAQALRERYPNYMRSEILEDELAQTRPEFRRSDSGEPIGKINKSFLKQKQGTQKIINTDVLDVVRRSLITKVSAAQKQKVVDQIATQFGKEIGQSIFKEGKIVTEVDPSKIPKGFVRSNAKSSSGKVFAVRKDIEDMLQGLNREQLDLVTKTMSSFNRIFKSGATTYRAPFVLSNFFRDAQEVFLKGRAIPGQASKVMSYGKALFSSVKEAMGIPDEVFHEWMKGGGSYGGVVTSYPKQVPIPAKLLSPKDKAARVIMNTVSLPFDAVRIPAEIMENTSRLAEYIRLKPTKLPEPLKILNSRDVTVDFEKMGDALRVWNNVIPFLNPAAQGTFNIARLFRDQPLLAAARVGAYVAAPTVGLYSWNKQFGNDNKVDPYIKDNFWYINTGATRQVDGEDLPVILTIRKGETSQLFSNPVQSLLEYSSKDLNFQNRIANFTPLGMAGNLVSFAMPPLLKEPFEQYANFDTFRGGPIIPERLKNVAPGRQFTNGTTDTARLIGEKTGISPARLEHGIQGIYPAAKQALEISDSILKPQPEVKRQDKGMFEKSRSFQPLIRTPSGFFSQEEAAARRFETKTKETGATPRFMFKEAYRQYLRERTPENLKKVQKWIAETAPESRGRVILEVNREMAGKGLEDKEKARRLLPLKRRGRFARELQDLTTE